MKSESVPELLSNFFALLSSILAIFLPIFARAGSWGLSVAHNNPLGAQIGGNLTYFGSNWTFEFGIGSLGGTTKANGTKRIRFDGELGGDIDLKYRFLTNFFQPFVETGLALGIGAENKGVGLGSGSPFLGGGFYLMGSKIYGVIAADYQVTSETLFGAVGLGVKF